MRSKSSAPREAPQGEVQTYVLVAGTASIPPGGPGTPEVNLKEGDTVDTHMPLDEMWPEKFAKADEAPVMKKGSARAAATRQALAAAAEAQEGDEAPEEKKSRSARKQEAQPETQEEEEDDGEEIDGDDVTDDFDDAKDNDLRVTHVVGTGYTIHDGKKAVNAEPLRTKTQVNSRLKDYIGK
jgi:hypothetical protein